LLDIWFRLVSFGSLFGFIRSSYAYFVEFSVCSGFVFRIASLPVPSCVIVSTTVAAPSGSLRPELCSLLAILTKIFGNTNQNVEGILTRFCMVIALVPLFCFSICLVPLTCSSVYFVSVDPFLHLLWLGRYFSLRLFGSVGLFSPFVRVSFVSSRFSDSGCRVATRSNPFTGPLLEDVLALPF